MKILFLIAAFLPSVVLAQKLDYERQKLDVQVQNYNTAAVGIYGNIAVAEAGTRKDWYGIQGGRRVSESAFYRVAGLKEEAGMAGSRESGRSIGTVLVLLGAPTMILGIGFMGSSAFSDSSKGDAEFKRGVILGLSGLAVTLLGGSLWAANDGNATEAGFAIKVAEVHNQQLRVRLGLGFEGK